MIFEGTSFLFKITYFVTAMLPAYILFSLQIKMQTNKVSDTLIYFILGIFLVLSVLSLAFLKWLLLKRGKEKNGHNKRILINRKNQIAKKNGDVVAFFMGIILPSVLVFQDELLITLIVFIILQILIFTLTIRGSSVFPNILLIFFGMDIYELEDGNYILTIDKKLRISDKPNLYTRLGDSADCNTYLIAEENENDI
ncbi:hypothetical protein [Listeria farberi]|uniref:Uncharacterized protein n=1 Tax=Listeria farberi TaxID=2713500 RepID=A0A7X0ZJP0_9LIST|nr:hypothetical protein [Listeria farberi]MBC1376335.1 hypothetical protein [Listeria farberi]MBC1380048.1 hypothetical protein [Listeria farberi]MBC2266289.1 hypothetical protein [Listeria farberi]MBC2288177.1 hypothetical protein [Listeria farberi]